MGQQTENHNSDIRMDANKKLDKNKDRFDQSLKRLKDEFGVDRDSDLARLLGVTQQAVYGATKRMRIPKKWFKKASILGISKDYILEGKADDIPQNKIDVTPEDIDIERLEKRISTYLVELMEKKNDSKFDDLSKSFLIAYTRKEILPKSLRSLQDLMEDAKILAGNQFDEKKSQI